MIKIISSFIKSLFKTREDALAEYYDSDEYKEWANRYKSLTPPKPGEREVPPPKRRNLPKSYERGNLRMPRQASGASYGKPKNQAPGKSLNIGEHNVKQQLDLLKSKSWCLHDVTLKMSNGNTCQIDHIVISKFGVFVIETKKRKGTVVGAPEDHKWHVLDTNGKYTESFYSPLKQNAVHVSRLVEKITGKVKSPFPVIPLLVFQEEDDYMMLSEGIVTPHSLVRKIANFTNKESNLSEQDMRTLYFFLKMENDKSQKTKEEHIANAQEAQTRSSVIAMGN